MQTVLRKRRPGPTRRFTHSFTYRGRLQCGTCTRHLYGEIKRTLIYYRCHLCRGTCVRENVVEAAIAAARVVTDVPDVPNVMCVVTGKEIRPMFCSNQVQMQN